MKKATELEYGEAKQKKEKWCVWLSLKKRMQMREESSVRVERERSEKNGVT